MAFGRKRKNKLDVEAIVEAHSAGEDVLPMLDTDDVLPERDDFDTEKADDGIKKAEQRMRRDAELEAKYAHVVPGSIRYVPKGEPIGDTKSKGRVATITCVDCGAQREVNCQDLFQTKQCVSCTKTHNLQRMKDKRTARAAARKASQETEPTTPESGGGSVA